MHLHWRLIGTIVYRIVHGIETMEENKFYKIIKFC